MSISSILSRLFSWLRGRSEAERQAPPQKATTQETARPKPAPTAPASTTQASKPAETQISAKPESQTAPTKPSNVLSEMDDGRIKFESFKYAAWGLEDAGNLRAWERIEDEAKRRRDPALLRAVRQERKSGDRAYQLAQELEQRCRKGDKDIEAWIAEIAQNEWFRIGQHLQRALQRQQNRKQTLTKRHKESRPHSTLDPVELVDGHHPNSLRHLAPATEWTILVDETGDVFEASDETVASPGKRGSMVAVALPEGTTLPPLENFHGSEVAGRQVDAVLGSLIKARAGIFGFSTREPLVHAGSWFGYIVQLLRWILWLLPTPEGSPISIKVRVENRGSYTSQQDLGAVAELLVSEFSDRDPGRYANLRLNLEIVGKDDPLIGYADAVAFTWMSPARESKDRLKRSKLKGSCLLKPDTQALDRLFLALSAYGTLPPADWYELAGATTSEADGLLARLLNDIGKRTQAEPHLWRACLEEVRTRMRLKNFDPAELAQAIEWLDRWAPAKHPLPATLRLQLEAAQLAAANHQGQVDYGRARTCLELIRELEEEVPQDACETVLRLAIAATNGFEFDSFRDEIERWLELPVAVAGLANYAKLHSTLGQLDAFTGRHEAALSNFDQSLALFERLSDPAQAQRERNQTAVYRLIACMDAPDANPEQVFAEITAQMQRTIGSSDAQVISRMLAYEDDHRHRFLHHLWLRTLTVLPQASTAAREEYLTHAEQWQTGTAHPWPLIGAYRAWMLKEAGRNDLATDTMARAIDACEDDAHGRTLAFMAEVFRALAQALDIAGIPNSSSEKRQELKRLLPAAPHEALERLATSAPGKHADVLAMFAACLPFNFH